MIVLEMALMSIRVAPIPITTGSTSEFGIYQVLVHTHPLPVYDGCCIQEVVSLQLVDSVYLSHATIILVEINAHLGRSFVPQGSCDLADLGQFYSFQYDVLDGINIKL